jgi:hypothetical protein
LALRPLIRTSAYVTALWGNAMRLRRALSARLVLTLTIVLAGCGALAAAELAIPPRIAPREIQKQVPKEIPKEKPRDVSVQTGPPNCARWTDDCVNCTRGAKDEAPVCSNAGFACQPKAIRCLGAQ